MGEGRGVHRILLRKPELMRSLGRHRRRRDDNIKVDLLEVGYGVMDWIELAYHRESWRALINAVMTFRVSKIRGIS
jgi:hypothetical protein